MKLFLLNRDSENDRAIEDVLHSKGKHQTELINGLLEDEKYQREAFKTMFLAQDARNKEITAQVESIQQELASLCLQLYFHHCQSTGEPTHAARDGFTRSGLINIHSFTNSCERCKRIF